jgi:MraZ protein
VERFHGTFEHSLDAKGRLILPARLRSHFDTKEAYVSVYPERCLAVWPPAQFSRHLARAEIMETRGTEGRLLARALTGMSTDAEFDGQWRLTIPPSLREYAGLEPDQPVMVVGALSRVELWQVELWRQRMAASIESIANGTSDLFSEPLPPPLPQAEPAVAPAGGAT